MIRLPLVAAAVSGLLAQTVTIPAAAQTWAPLHDSRRGERGAAVCADDAATGNYLCLVLRCRGSGPVEFALLAAGGDFGTGQPFDVGLAVDGRPVAVLGFAQLVGAEGLEAVAAYDPSRHGDLIAALRAGSRLGLTLYGRTHPLGLRGSARQIDRVLGICDAPAPAAGTEALGAEEVRTLVGRRLSWAPDHGVIFLPDGRYQGVLGGRANNGSYRIEADGRLCWQGIARGCFRFLRRDDGLEVRRDDAESQALLGRVRVLD